MFVPKSVFTALQAPKRVVTAFGKPTLRWCIQQQPIPRRTLATEASRTVSTNFWQKISRWEDVPLETFVKYSWQLTNSITNKKLEQFLSETVPESLVPSTDPRFAHIITKADFIEDALKALEIAPMNIRITPYILSRIDWHQALDNPLRRQFVPLKSCLIEDHPKLTLDSLGEEADSPVKGLVHRYPSKALFLATSICPVYCRFCTRSYAVGGNTASTTKTPQKPSRKRWETLFEYIENTKSLKDIVVSGGDTYYLPPDEIKTIGERLLAMDHIRYVRFATKGLAVAPMRTIDPDDEWTRRFIELSKLGRRLGKEVCLHTHFNHPDEISWITKEAARYLYEHGVIVRNQTVLLKGVNDEVETMRTLINMLGEAHIKPYYVYQCDLVKGVEDLRTPLSTILRMEEEIRGTVSGHIMPHFVVDLPGGGGKRHACSYRDYSPTTGVAIYTASGLPGTKGQKTYEYHDPEWSLQSKTASKSTVGLREIGASYRDVVQPISTGPRRTRDTPIGLGHLAPTDQEDTTDELPEAISSYAHG